MSAGSESYSSQQSYQAAGTDGTPICDIAGTTPVYTQVWFLSFQVCEIAVLITTALATSDAVVTVKRNKVGGGTGSDTTIGTFTLPFAADLAGDVYRVDVRTVANSFLAPGESISFTSDGVPSAGNGIFGVIGYESRFGNDPYPFQSFTTVDKDRSGVGDIIYLAFTAA